MAEITVVTIKPNPDCPACGGSGEVSDSHPWGSTHAIEWSYCDCVIEQAPEDDTIEIELDLSDYREDITDEK